MENSRTKRGSGRFWTYLAGAIAAVLAGLMGVNVLIDQAVAELNAGGVSLEAVIARFALPPVFIGGVGAMIRLLAHVMKAYPGVRFAESVAVSAENLDFLGKAAAVTAFVLALSSALAAAAKFG